jgi:hypothetical protein
MQAAQNADAMIRPAWPVIQAAQEHVEQARAAQAQAVPGP